MKNIIIISIIVAFVACEITGTNDDINQKVTDTIMTTDTSALDTSVTIDSNTTDSIGTLDTIGTYFNDSLKNELTSYIWASKDMGVLDFREENEIVFHNKPDDTTMYYYMLEKLQKDTIILHLSLNSDFADKKEYLMALTGENLFIHGFNGVGTAKYTRNIKIIPPPYDLAGTWISENMDTLDFIGKQTVIYKNNNSSSLYHFYASGDSLYFILSHSSNFDYSSYYVQYAIDSFTIYGFNNNLKTTYNNLNNASHE